MDTKFTDVTCSIMISDFYTLILSASETQVISAVDYQEVLLGNHFLNNH